MIRLSDTTIDDRTTPQDLERIRRDVFAALRELQKIPAAQERILASVTLVDGVPTPIPHGLGRPAVWVKESCVRGAVSNGRIDEIRDGKNDRAKYVTLKATGYGATITVDVRVL